MNTATLLPLHIANGRREAREIVLHPERHGEQRRRIAWAALTGMPVNPRFQGPQPNLGAAVASPEWPMSAVVIESGAAPWGANDAG